MLAYHTLPLPKDLSFSPLPQISPASWLPENGFVFVIFSDTCSSLRKMQWEDFFPGGATPAQCPLSHVSTTNDASVTGESQNPRFSRSCWISPLEPLALSILRLRPTQSILLLLQNLNRTFSPFSLSALWYIPVVAQHLPLHWHSQWVFFQSSISETESYHYSGTHLPAH